MDDLSDAVCEQTYRPSKVFTGRKFSPRRGSKRNVRFNNFVFFYLFICFFALQNIGLSSSYFIRASRLKWTDVFKTDLPGLVVKIPDS